MEAVAAGKAAMSPGDEGPQREYLLEGRQWIRYLSHAAGQSGWLRKRLPHFAIE